ncbi:SLBB domain-containing protein [Verrucomicrobiaceae bacterium R5-34]|nr:SLBB domain-containing protein [Verrucomicrobiaceae bacterium R5-34]
MNWVFCSILGLMLFSVINQAPSLAAGVQVVAADPAPQRFLSVAGEVKKPGRVPYRRGLTLQQAVTEAGGPTVFGRLNRVYCCETANVTATI